MSSTREGGLKAAETNKLRYGNDFYHTIGRAGGAKSKGGGFAKNPELAKIAGKKGGSTPRKKKPVRQTDPVTRNWWEKLLNKGLFNDDHR